MKIFVLLVVANVALAASEDVCRYEFSVPKPASGCDERSKEMEDRVARLEKLLQIGDQPEEESLATQISNLKEVQQTLNRKLTELTSYAVTTDVLNSVVLNINRVANAVTQELNLRIGNMSLLLTSFVGAQSELSSSLTSRIDSVQRQTTKYFEDLMSVKTQVTDLKINGNQSKDIVEIQQDILQLKRDSFFNDGNYKAQFQELRTTGGKIQTNVEQQQTTLQILRTDVNGAADHIQRTTFDITQLKVDVTNLQELVNSKVGNLQSNVNLVRANVETLMSELERIQASMTSLNMTTSEVSGVEKHFQTALQHLQQRIGGIMNSLRTQTSNVESLGKKLEDYGDVVEIRQTMDTMKQQVYPKLQSEYNKLEELQGKVTSIQKMFQMHIQVFKNTTMCIKLKP